MCKFLISGLFSLFLMPIVVFAAAGANVDISGIRDKNGDPIEASDGYAYTISKEYCKEFMDKEDVKYGFRDESSGFKEFPDGFSFDTGLQNVESCYVEYSGDESVWYVGILYCEIGYYSYSVWDDDESLDSLYIEEGYLNNLMGLRCLGVSNVENLCKNSGGEIADLGDQSYVCNCWDHDKVVGLTQDGVECLNYVNLSGITTVDGEPLLETDGVGYTISREDCAKFMGKDNVGYGFISDDIYWFSFDFDKELQNVKTCRVQYSESEEEWYVGIADCEDEFYSYSVYDENNMLTYQYNDAGHEYTATGFKCIEESVAENMCGGKGHIKEEYDKAWYCDCEKQRKQHKATEEGALCIEDEDASPENPEEVCTEINVAVKDSQGKPIKGAHVLFGSTKNNVSSSIKSNPRTDEKGKASFVLEKLRFVGVLCPNDNRRTSKVPEKQVKSLEGVSSADGCKLEFTLNCSDNVTGNSQSPTAPGAQSPQVGEPTPAEQAKTLIDKLDPVYNRISGQKSVWKNKEGDFNTSRLISDGVAAVVLGTAGVVITSNIVKKNQIKYGFEDLKCHIGGQPVAGYGDAFRVGQ